MAYLCPHQCDGKTEYGYCRYTWCVNPLHSNFGTAQQGQGVQRTAITNADRIRAMTDEELAELWWERVDCGECPVHKECNLTGQECKRLVLNWLKQEATDG